MGIENLLSRERPQLFLYSRILLSIFQMNEDETRVLLVCGIRRVFLDYTLSTQISQ